MLPASRQLFLLTIVILLTSLPAWGKERLVSVILAGNLERYRLAQQAFDSRLAELPPLKDVKFYIQNPNPDPVSLANSIRKAVAFDTELIITYGAQAALVAQREVRKTPVLFADVYDPVNLNLVRCVEEVSCDFSGISGTTPLQTLIKTFLAINADAGKIALIYSSDDPGSVLQSERFSAIAAQFGLVAEGYDLQRRSALPDTLKKIAESCRTIFISDSTLVQLLAEEILQFANGRQILVVSQIPGLCDKGALLSLEPNPSEQGSRLADYAHAVLSGQKIRSLPVISPKKVDLVINLALARENGLKIPFNVLTMATKVVK